jgi:predicted ATP-dependent endonuclease of OLD family
LRINVKKGEIKDKRFKPYKEFKPRDIMVEGSGFLQWLSVYTYALSRNIDVLLLDEPDAHLHNSLQIDLFKRLSAIAQQYNKQFIISTHSGELIKEWDCNEILYAQGSHIKYIQQNNDKIKIINNLGSEYCPILDSIKMNKRILFVENESDVTILKELCEKMGKQWPSNITVWPHANSHKERTHIFKYLINEIHGLKAISLNDRDTKNSKNITESLKDKSYNDSINGDECLYYRTWQRHEIENYLFDVEPIARAIAKKNNRQYNQALIDEVRNWFHDEHGLVFNANFRGKKRTNALDSLFDKDGHELMDSLKKKYHIKPINIAREMHSDEIFEDIKTFVNEVIKVCS